MLRLGTNHSQGLPLQPHELITLEVTVNHMNLAIARATVMKDMAGEALDMIIIIVVVAANSTMNLIGKMEGGDKIIIIAAMMIEIGGITKGVIDQAGDGIENLSEIIIIIHVIAETALKIHIGTIPMDKITRGVMRNVINMVMIMAMLITMALTMIMVQLLLEMSIEHNTKEGPTMIQRLLKMRINRTAKQSSHPRPLLRRRIRRSFPKLRS